MVKEMSKRQALTVWFLCILCVFTFCHSVCKTEIISLFMSLDQSGYAPDDVADRLILQF